MIAVLKNTKYFTDVVKEFSEIAEIFPSYHIAEENYGMKLAILVNIENIEQLERLARLDHNGLQITFDAGRTFEHNEPYDFIIMIDNRD